MTKFVTIVGNGESRFGFDLTPLKQFSTVIGCNAQFRDYVFESFVCCDRHMCQEAANTVGKNTAIYTRKDWSSQFAMWPNVKSRQTYHTKELKDKMNRSIGAQVLMLEWWL